MIATLTMCYSTHCPLFGMSIQVIELFINNIGGHIYSKPHTQVDVSVCTILAFMVLWQHRHMIMYQE